MKALKDWETLEAEYKQEKRLLLEEYKEHVTKGQNQLDYFKKEIEVQGQELLDLKNISAEQAANLLAQSLEHFRSTINGILDLLTRKYPALAEELLETRQDYTEYLSDYEAQIEVIRSYTKALQIIESSIAVQHHIVFRGSLIKLGAYKKVEKFLRTILSESITVEKHNEIVDNLDAEYAERKAKLQAHYNGNYQATLAEYQNDIDGKCEQFQAELSDICNQGLEDAERIEKLETAINESYRELTNALQSHRFPGNTEQARVGNDISRHYAKLGYILDAMEWQTSETGYTLIFHTSRNGNKHINADMLNDGDNPEKLKEISGAINKPEFEVNYRGGTVSLEIQKKYPPKKDTAKSDIDAIWIPATKFEFYVKRWERVRITAGSTGGKSPTAKNLALAIMNSRKGKGKIRLYDPQHGSKKDYWDMPKAGTSHEDNLKGMKELCLLIDDRRHGHNHQFVLYIFDEVDNTVTQLKEGAKFRDLIKVSLKEGSHADVGVIYIGQSADANEVPGMTHSNWNNAVQLHIGTNAGTAIEKLTTLTTDDKTKLLNQYRKIQEYCDRMNEELGLDIFTDSGAYRFALAVPLTGLPKFIQLPAFDSYDYTEVMGVDTTTVKPVVEVPSNEIKCPHCDSSAVKRNGRDKNTRTIQQYKCNSCGKPFSENDLIN